MFSALFGYVLLMLSGKMMLVGNGFIRSVKQAYGGRTQFALTAWVQLFRILGWEEVGIALEL